MKEGWEFKKLGDLCQVLDSQRKPVTKKDRTKGIYPYYGATGIQDYVDSYIFDGRFLLVGEDGAKWGASDKTAYIIEGKSWVNNHAHILKVLENVNDRLLEYYLTFKDLSEYITGAVVPKLTQKALVSIPIPIPPLSEQQHIVEELDLLSSIIEKKKAQLKELDNLAQSLFYEMFGDPIINNMEWEVKTLKELVYIGLGFTHTPQYVEKGVPFISVKDISSGYIDLSKIKYVSKEEYDNAPKGAKPQKGDLMFCRVGTMGKPLIVETDMQFCTFVSVGYMRRLQNNIDMSFLKYWMLSNSFDKQVEANVRGLAIKNLNTGWLKNFSIYLPPLSIQQQFAEKVQAIEHQKEFIKQSIREVETLFNSRMDYYFN